MYANPVTSSKNYESPFNCVGDWLRAQDPWHIYQRLRWKWLHSFDESSGSWYTKNSKETDRIRLFDCKYTGCIRDVSTIPRGKFNIYICYTSTNSCWIHLILTVILTGDVGKWRQNLLYRCFCGPCINFSSNSNELCYLNWLSTPLDLILVYT